MFITLFSITSIIKLNNYRKNYGREFISIIGLSSSGKTSLFYYLKGFNEFFFIFKN